MVSNSWFPFHTYALEDFEHEKIFCFHHAGGTAGVYRKWTLDKGEKNFICVELPGKGTRRRETFVDNFRLLLPEIAQNIMDVVKQQEFTLFGHSMGAAMAFYVADYIEEHFGKHPKRIVAAGRQAPQDEDPCEFKSFMNDEALIAELKKYNATPPEILENKELLQFILPEVRKDYKLNESLIYHGEQVDTPIYLHAGTEDFGATKEIMSNWNSVTTQGTKFTEFSGDHFFVLNSSNYQEFLAKAI